LELLVEKRFTYPLKTVFVNTTLSDGDDIQVIHLMSGG